MAGLTETTAIPDHVPPGAVYDFDMRFDPALLANPHERVRELLRDAPPVFWTPRNGGRWIAIGHEEVFQASRDPEHFSSTYMPREQMEAMLAMMPKGMPRIPQAVPITLDPPEHAKYRAPLQHSFSPKAVLARKEAIGELADELIDAVIDQGHCDFIPAIAEPLPVRVFLRMMGLPEARLGEFRELVHEYLSKTLVDPMEGASMSRKVADAMLGEITARKDDPKDDLISVLWQTEIDGKPMTLELMEDYAVLLFVAGLDTVINGMGFGIRHLAMNPELQDELRADPGQIPGRDGRTAAALYFHHTRTAGGEECRIGRLDVEGRGLARPLPAGRGSRSARVRCARALRHETRKQGSRRLRRGRAPLPGIAFGAG